MKIDSLLERFIDRQVQIAMNSFAKDMRQSSLKNTILQIMTGLRLAEINEGGDEMLVRSEEFIVGESKSAEIAEGNVSIFVRSYVEQNQRPMTKSLRLLVNHMMAMERKQSNGPEIDEEGLWVQLACGSSIQLCPTCFWATGRDFIWCASPQLVVSCPMRQPLASNHPRAAKSDKVLRAIASEFCSVAASPRSLVGQLLSIHSV